MFFFILCLGVCAWLWQNAWRCHGVVIKISRKVCKELNYQHLDQTVILRKLSFGFKQKSLVAYRTYAFEYSVRGHDRHRGEIGLCNNAPQWMRLFDPDGMIHFELDKFGRVSDDELSGNE